MNERLIRLNEKVDSLPFDLTEEQYAYCKDVICGEGHVSNWSVAGSGKSLCLEIIKDVLGDECAVCATTGIANAILFNSKGAQGTAHKLFSLTTEIHNEYNFKRIGDTTREVLSKTDIVKVVIIEEAGMLNPDQLAQVVKRIERFNKAYSNKRKKRNIKLVLQGDFLQLGSVITKQEEIDYMREVYGSEYLFESNVFKDLDFNVHIFSKVLRTNDKTFQACLDVVRYGQEHRYDKCLQWINKRWLQAPEGIPVITTTNKMVDKMNMESLQRNPNPMFELRPTVQGKYDMKNCPVDEVLYLKVGAPVICLKNCNEGNFFNGSYGHVTDIVVGEGVYVRLASNGREVFVPMFEYEEREYTSSFDKEGKPLLTSKVIGTCMHYTVKVAACFSVFRMQGRTIDSPVLIDLGWGFPEDQDNSWGMAQAYVALSRATSVEHVYLKQKLTRKHLKVNKKAVEWVAGNKKT
ncbi:MAG: AAA family ATPase [bacterium]|nr:AAA family ATPase [bacterium]